MALHGAAGRWLQGACLAAAVTLSLTAIPAGAAGLGQLVIQSHLGEPLRAHIEIVGLQPGEEAQVRIAPRAVHTRISRPPRASFSIRQRLWTARACASS